MELVRVTTRDDIRLDGILRLPKPARPVSAEAENAENAWNAEYNPTASAPIDAVICIHGTTGNFYTSTLFDVIGERLLGMGIAVLRINTRGHDGVCTVVTSRGGRRLGAAYEVVDDCRHDLHAWIEWLRGRGFQRLMLLGHSLGAVKTIYCQAHEPHSAVARIATLSPPRLSHHYFLQTDQAVNFRDSYTLAEREVIAGRGNSLIEVTFPMAMAIAASGYLEKYGPDDRYHFLPLLDRFSCPILLTFGSVEMEQNVAFANLPALIAPLGNRRVVVVAGADHFYTGLHSVVADHLADWLQAT